MAHLERVSTYQEFWPIYLREHSRRATRRLHYIGTALSIAAIIAAIATQNWWLLLLAPLSGYGFAWISHFAIEKNKPATWQYPYWSLFSDYRMFFHAMTGTLAPELKRHHVVDPDAQAEARPAAGGA